MIQLRGLSSIRPAFSGAAGHRPAPPAWARTLGLLGWLLVAAAPVAAEDEPARPAAQQHAIAELITQCSDDHRRFFASGLTRPQYLLFCNCYVHSALDAIDDAEVAYRRVHDGAPSPKFVETSNELVPACSAEAMRRAPAP